MSGLETAAWFYWPAELRPQVVSPLRWAGAPGGVKPALFTPWALRLICTARRCPDARSAISTPVGSSSITGPRRDLALARKINQRLNRELFKPEYETIKGHEHGLGLELMSHGDPALVEKVKRVKQQYDPFNFFNPHLLQPPAPAGIISEQFTCVAS